MLQLRESHRVSQLFGLVLGLSLYFYRVREILACWLFFSILFVVLALLVLGAALAWYAGKWATDWPRTAMPLTPVTVVASAGVDPETTSGPRRLK